MITNSLTTIPTSTLILFYFYLCSSMLISCLLNMQFHNIVRRVVYAIERNTGKSLNLEFNLWMEIKVAVVINLVGFLPLVNFLFLYVFFNEKAIKSIMLMALGELENNSNHLN